MNVAVRSYLTAGVALVGVGAIVTSPITPSLPAIQRPTVSASTAAVELSAMANPIEAWINILPHTVNNLLSLATVIRADPAPVLQQIIANETGYGQTLATGLTGAGQALTDYATGTVPAAFNAIAAALSQGDIVGAGSEVVNVLGSLLLVGFPLFDVLTIPGEISDNLTNVVHALTGLGALMPLAFGVLFPVDAAVAAASVAGQAFVDAIGSGDPMGAVNSFLSAPAAVTDAFLNGYESEDGQTTFPGLLSINPQSPSAAGLVQTLMVTLPQAIAQALGATPPYTTLRTARLTAAPAEVDSVPAATAPIVTLSTPTSAPSPAVPKLAVQAESEAPAATDGTAGASEPDESKANAAVTAVSDSLAESVTTKDGNKVVPGEVTTGVGADSATTTTSTERTKSPVKAVRQQVKSALGKLGLKKGAGDKAGAGGA